MFIYIIIPKDKEMEKEEEKSPSSRDLALNAIMRVLIFLGGGASVSLISVDYSKTLIVNASLILNFIVAILLIVAGIALFFNWLNELFASWWKVGIFWLFLLVLSCIGTPLKDKNDNWILWNLIPLGVAWIIIPFYYLYNRKNQGSICEQAQPEDEPLIPKQKNECVLDIPPPKKEDVVLQPIENPKPGFEEINKGNPIRGPNYRSEIGWTNTYFVFAIESSKSMTETPWKPKLQSIANFFSKMKKENNIKIAILPFGAKECEMKVFDDPQKAATEVIRLEEPGKDKDIGKAFYKHPFAQLITIMNEEKKEKEKKLISFVLLTAEESTYPQRETARVIKLLKEDKSLELWGNILTFSMNHNDANNLANALNFSIYRIMDIEGKPDLIESLMSL